MFIVSGQKAKLIQCNRNNEDEIFDDQDRQEVNIKVCPYNIDQGIKYGIYTVPEATGYYIVSRYVDVRPGDQIIFMSNKDIEIKNQVHTVLKVQDSWIFNRVENYVLAVK